jgi:DNA-binding response OmpR family regulator
VPTDDTLRRRSRRLGVPAIDLDQAIVYLDVLRLVPEDVVRRLQVLPIRAENGQMFVAVADPTNASAVDEVAFRSGHKCIAYVADESRLRSVIDECIDARRRGDYQWRGPSAARGEGAKALEHAVLPELEDDGIPVTFGSMPPVGPPPSEPADLARPPEAKAKVPTAPPATLEPFANESSFKSQRSSDPGRRTRPRVLIVDDEPVIRQILKQGLAPRNFEIIEASGGQEALRVIKDKEPDVVLLDAMLPDIHGFDICKRLRESPRYRALPIILITAVYKGWRIAADLKDAYGVYAYIEKPFDLRDVVSAIEDAVSGRAPGARAAAEEYGAEARRLYAEASAAFRTGDLDTAIASLATAVSIDPLSASLRHQLGLLYAQRGHDFQAIQELETAIDLEPSRYQSLRNLAILFQRRGFRRKSFELWERALTAAPDDAARREIRDILLQLI